MIHNDVVIATDVTGMRVSSELLLPSTGILIGMRVSRTYIINAVVLQVIVICVSPGIMCFPTSVAQI